MRVGKRILQNRTAMVCILFLAFVSLVGIFAPFVAPHDPTATDTPLKYAAPSLAYPLGNDQLGRCVLSRLIYGIRTSFLLVLATMLVTVAIGSLLGIVAGFFGGKTDAFIMRLCDIMMSFPSEVMTLAIVGILGVGLQNILPSALAEIIVIGSSSISSMILLISGLSFLGLGIQPPQAEWGMMLSEAKNVMYAHPFFMIPPGVSVMLVSVAAALLSDSMRDVLDPQFAGKKGGQNG